LALIALSEKTLSQGVDNPLPLKLGIAYKVDAYKQNQISISLPAGAAQFDSGFAQDQSSPANPEIVVSNVTP
jgi:hypothetical protein